MPRELRATRQERLAEVKEYALDLLDSDRYSTYSIIAACERYISSNWGLSGQTKKDYLEWLKEELKEIFRQRERRMVSRNSI